MLLDELQARKDQINALGIRVKIEYHLKTRGFIYESPEN